MRKVPEGNDYKRVVIVTGNNDIQDQESDTVVKTYKDVVIAAKEISSSVTISGLPPCTKSVTQIEKLRTLNAGLQVLAAEERCTFVDHDETFTLRNGEVNDGFLDADKVHPNLLGSNRIAKALDLTCKNRENYDIATRNPNKKPAEKRIMKKQETAPTGPKFTSRRVFSDSQSPSYQKKIPVSKKRCKNCYEHNHETNDCGFRGKVVCRRCSNLGHKQKFCHEFTSNFYGDQ